jgi:hypothetical protein
MDQCRRTPPYAVLRLVAVSDRRHRSRLMDRAKWDLHVSESFPRNPVGLGHWHLKYQNRACSGYEACYCSTYAAMVSPMTQLARFSCAEVAQIRGICRPISHIQDGLSVVITGENFILCLTRSEASLRPPSLMSDENQVREYRRCNLPEGRPHAAASTSVSVTMIWNDSENRER